MQLEPVALDDEVRHQAPQHGEREVVVATGRRRGARGEHGDVQTGPRTGPGPAHHQAEPGDLG